MSFLYLLKIKHYAFNSLKITRTLLSTLSSCVLPNVSNMFDALKKKYPDNGAFHSVTCRYNFRNRVRERGRKTLSVICIICQCTSPYVSRELESNDAMRTCEPLCLHSGQWLNSALTTDSGSLTPHLSSLYDYIHELKYISLSAPVGRHHYSTLMPDNMRPLCGSPQPSDLKTGGKINPSIVSSNSQKESKCVSQNVQLRL